MRAHHTHQEHDKQNGRAADSARDGTRRDAPQGTGVAASPGALLGLQRSAGNAAVTQMLRESSSGTDANGVRGQGRTGSVQRSAAPEALHSPTVSKDEARGEAAAVQRHVGSAHEGAVIQRYTSGNDQNLGRIDLSENGRFVIQPGGEHVWVRDDARGQVAPALRATGQQIPINGATYHQYWLGGPILFDCLHAAEEIINNQVGQLAWGEDEYSTIDTRSRGKERFGQADPTNRRQARQFAGQRDVAASPEAGQAFVIVATKPGGETMSQFHAAAVVARDGQDCIALEVWSDNGNPPARGSANAAIYTVDDMQRSFHTSYGGEGTYFEKVGPITVVVKPGG